MDNWAEAFAAGAARKEAAKTSPGEPEPHPFMLIEPLRRSTPLIFTSPHSGSFYPASFLTRARVGLASLRRAEDAYVDELFAGVGGHGAPLLSALIGRAYLDLNRDPAELDPDMFADPPPATLASSRVLAGLGAIPRIAGDGQAIYSGKLAAAEAAGRIARIHKPYHGCLSHLIEETLARFGCAVLIDCHSMPSSARVGETANIVLGDRFGASCHPSITTLVEAILTRLGYRVTRNAPFAGGFTTQTFGRPYRNCHALQIEICRSLYMDERTMTRHAGFKKVRADMTRLCAALAAAELHRSLA